MVVKVFMEDAHNSDTLKMLTQGAWTADLADQQASECWLWKLPQQQSLFLSWHHSLRLAVLAVLQLRVQIRLEWFLFMSVDSTLFIFLQLLTCENSDISMLDLYNRYIVGHVLIIFTALSFYFLYIYVCGNSCVCVLCMYSFVRYVVSWVGLYCNLSNFCDIKQLLWLMTSVHKFELFTFSCQLPTASPDGR